MSDYVRQTWVAGESPLSAERMNHIEDGILGVQSKVTTTASTINASITALDNSKADRTDLTNPFVFKGNTVFASLPTSGNTVNDTYYVTDKKCKYTWNGTAWYVSSIDETDYENELGEVKSDLGELDERTDKEIKSIIETNVLFYGGVVKVNGNTYYESNDITIDITPEVGKKYTLIAESQVGSTSSNLLYIMYYDEGNTKIGQATSGNNLTLTSTVPSGCSKIKISCVGAEGTRMPTGEATFYGVTFCSGTQISRKMRDDLPYERMSNAESSILTMDNSLKSAVYSTTKNIANVSIIDGRINTDTGNAYIPSDLPKFAISNDFMSVESSNDYVISFGKVFPHINGIPKKPDYTITVMQYANDKTYLGSDNLVSPTWNGYGYIFKTGSSTKYIKIQFKQSTYEFDDMIFEEMQIEKGFMPTSYVNPLGVRSKTVDANQIYKSLVDDGTFTRDYIVPSYYFENNYIQNKVKRINELGASCYKHGDGFIFITDEHWDSNQKKSPSLIKYIYDRCHIEKLFNGGDTYSVGISDECVQDIRRAFGGSIYSTAGNHEYFGGTTFSKVEYVYDTDGSEIVWGNSEKRYYYVDNKRAKIRYIFPTLFYEGPDNSVGGWAIDNDQVYWIANVAMNVESGWGMVFVTHMVYLISYNDARTIDRTTHADNLTELIDNYNGNGEVIAIFQGHVHMDRVTSTPNGVPIIMTTCDKNIHTSLTVGSWTGDDMIDDRPSDTIKEQAFDVNFINRTSRTITCLRIGCSARNGIDDNIGSYVEERVINY